MTIKPAISLQPHPSSISAINLLQNVPRYESVINRIKAWILSFFDYTMRIQDSFNHSHFYVRTQDLVRSICSLRGQPLPVSDKIHRLVIENIHPIIGIDLTTKKIQRFLDKFYSVAFRKKLQSIDNEKVIETLVSKRLEKFKNRKLAVISVSDIESSLKPGDILFKNSLDGQSFVVGPQRIIAPTIMGKQERQGYQFSHAAIYLGHGKIAESTSYSKFGTRILDIHDPDFALHPGTHYIVTRFADSRIANQAAKIAKSLAVEDKIDHPHSKTYSYHYGLAALSALASPGFGPFGRFRYLKQYIEDHEHQPPMDFLSLKGFFCSYFVGYCYQTAESRIVMPQIFLPDNEPYHRCSSGCNALLRRIWTFFKTFQLWGAMNDRVKLDFDAKRITPHELRNFVVAKPELFTDLYLVKASA